MKNNVLILLIFICTTCKKEVGPTPTPDNRDKYIGVYKGSLIDNKGCTKIDSIPIIDTQFDITMLVYKFGSKGLGFKSIFFNYEFDTISYETDTTINFWYHIGGKYIISNSITFKNNSISYYYLDQISNQFNTKCPIIWLTKNFNAIKL